MDVTGKLSIEISSELKGAVANYSAGLKELEARRLRAKKISAELAKAEKSKEDLVASLAATELACRTANALDEMRVLQGKIQSIRNDLEWTNAVIANLRNRESEARGHEGGWLEAVSDNKFLLSQVFQSIRQTLVNKFKNDKEFIELLKIVYVVTNEARGQAAYRAEHVLYFLFGISEDSLINVHEHDFFKLKNRLLADAGCDLPDQNKKN